MKGWFSYRLWREVVCGLQQALAGLRNLFFVRTCVVCGGVLDEEPVMPGSAPVMPGLTGHLCRRCTNDIPLTYFWNYSENAAMDTLGGRCRVYNAASLFFYRHDSDYCEIVRRCKYGGDVSLGFRAGEMLGRYLAGGGLYGDIQVIVPVPLHPLKRWRRGFNQAEIIAKGIAKGLQPGVGIETRLLYRKRYTSTQTRKSASGRAGNVAGAFGVRKRVAERLRASGVRHILIVDDVLTTGATLAACIRLLEDAFTVSAATLGFVEH